MSPPYYSTTKPQQALSNNKISTESYSR